MVVPFFLHDLGQAELDAIAAVFAGPMLTTGETVDLFESRFAGYLGCRHVVGLTSCTGALHLAMLALGIRPGDEVITTPMTFAATATAILEAGAKPVFVDVDQHTGLIDVDRIEAAITQRTRMILPVHLYGQMCDMRAIRSIAGRHGLRVVEDAAHCIEGTRDGVRPGELSDAACFSFYATKNITCGEGGALATNSAELAAKVRLLRLHGMTKTASDRAREGYAHWDLAVLGWKYNMDNIQAAMLLPQMDRLEANWHKRSQLAQHYEEMLTSIRGIARPRTVTAARHAWHLFPIWVAAERRDELISRLQAKGIGAVVNYRPVHLLTLFRQECGHREGDFPHAERIGACTLSLPFYPRMPLDHVDQVIKALQDSLV